MPTLAKCTQQKITLNVSRLWIKLQFLPTLSTGLLAISLPCTATLQSQYYTNVAVKLCLTLHYYIIIPLKSDFRIIILPDLFFFFLHFSIWRCWLQEDKVVSTAFPCYFILYVFFNVMCYHSDIWLQMNKRDLPLYHMLWICFKAYYSLRDSYFCPVD